MTERQRGYVQVEDGVELFYEFFQSSPSKENILCINGLFQSLFNWYRVKDHLFPEYNLLLFDLRGQGKTKVNPNSEISLDRHAMDIETLLHHLSLKRVSIAAMSYGGYIGLIFAGNHPEIVEKMVLLGVGDGQRLEMIIDDWSNMVSLLGDFAFLKFVLPTLFSSRFIEQNRDSMDKILDALIERNDTENLIKMLASITPHPSFRELISHLSHPVLHIVGGEDALLSVSRLHQTVHDLGGSHRIEVIPGAGHTLIEEEPEKVAHYIKEFLRE